MIYQTVWKPHTTPLGRQIYRLRASARRTSDSEHSLVRSGWPTPAANKHTKNSKDPHKLKEGGVQTALADATWLSGWPTPMAADTIERKSVGYIERRKNLKFPITTAMEAVWQLSGWPTPRANDAEKRGAVADDPRNGLVTAGNLSGWPTPMAADNRDRGSWDDPAIQRRKRIGKSIELSMLVGCAHGAARITADGTMLTGCSAGMGSGGQLNPAFSGWLMGFPEAWCRAAISCQLPAPLRKAPKRPVA